MNATELLKYSEAGNKQAWIGLYPQFNADIINIEACTNYRLIPDFHGKYDIVWCYEKPLNEYHILSWKIILDEAIRLLKENGKLIIRMYETADYTVPMIKNFLGRNVNLEVEIDYESHVDNCYIIVFNIKRLNFEIYQDKSWTFAMLTNGQKDDVVVKFLESIRENESQKSQIIISGPKKDIYDKYDVEYLDLSKYRDNEYAEISKKKNDIAKMATGANILMAHDRYYLDKNFFRDFEKFGYDFDFLAIKQISDIDNKEYPFYCYNYNQPLNHTHVGYSNCYSKIFNTQYVNGGLMVFKTSTLKKIEFNDLIFWNQKEDVEISYEFMDKSVIPRVNYIAVVFTNRASDDYPFDCFDGNKFRYNVEITKKTKPTVYGVKEEKKFFVNIFFYKKNHFPFFGFQLKFRKRKK